MATFQESNVKSDDKRESRRKQVMLGELPMDFLRVTPMTEQQQLAVDEQAAMALQQQLSGNLVTSTVTGRLSISVIEAKLNKNYGLTRMDPYVRLRIGQTVYETHTDYNGAKNPRWNKVFHCFFYPNATSIYIEIFDECAFSLDEKIAWAHYVVPETVLHGDTIEEWIPLTGRLGDEKEGVINLVLTYSSAPSGTLLYHSQPMVAVMPYGVSPSHAPAGYPQYAVQNTTAPCSTFTPVKEPVVQQPVAQQPIQIIEEDLQQVKEMFPNIEEDVIRTVMESNRGNKDQSINTLLALSEDT